MSVPQCSSLLQTRLTRLIQTPSDMRVQARSETNVDHSKSEGSGEQKVPLIIESDIDMIPLQLNSLHLEIAASDPIERLRRAVRPEGPGCTCTSGQSTGDSTRHTPLCVAKRN